jgi:peptidoglycan-N-acetylglucosamine deacetylase
MSEVEWPQGNRAAASFTFDVDAESVWIAMDPANAERPGLLSQAMYGPKVGVPLILEVLLQQRIKSTFFIPGVNVELYPEMVSSIINAGHEVALHGYTHTRPTQLAPEQEQAELDRAFALLSAAGGAVSGYRSPGWEVSSRTLDLLEEKGLTYSSQFMDDFRPYRHRDKQLVELPVQWILDDWPHFGWHVGDSARTIKGTLEVEQIWREEFDEIRKRSGSYILTMHPEVTGRPSRVALLNRMIEYVRSHGDVWIATCGEIAAYVDRHLAPS